MNRTTTMTIALVAVLLSAPQTPWAQPSRDQAAETIAVRLSSFAFNPDPLRLRVGVPVRLHIENVSSGGHNFSAPALFAASIFPLGSPAQNGKVEVAGKSSVDITLTPRAPGTYKVECTHFLHSLFGMTGTIIVVGP